MVSRLTVQFIQQTLKKHLNISEYKVFIFGSQAEGNTRRSSDIDIGIEGEKPIDLLTLSNIESDLEDSNIPETIDIVDFSRVSDNFRTVAKQHIVPLN